MNHAEREMLEQIVQLRSRVDALERQERGVPVVAMYTTDAGQSIPNLTNTIVNFGTQVTDTHGAVTTGTGWKFTAPVAGQYLVAATIAYEFSTAWAEGQRAQLRAHVNGDLTCELGAPWLGMTSGSVILFATVGGAALVSLASGATLDVRTRQNSGGARTLQAVGTVNHIGIHLIR